VDVIATVTSKGQVTMTKRVRDALGIGTGDRILFHVGEDGRASIERIPDFIGLAGSVPVPPELKGKDWREIRSDTWRRVADERAGTWRRNAEGDQ
jgi:AbrB family looped-hinge helix DNA binding protein